MQNFHIWGKVQYSKYMQKKENTLRFIWMSLTPQRTGKLFCHAISERFLYYFLVLRINDESTGDTPQHNADTLGLLRDAHNVSCANCMNYQISPFRLVWYCFHGIAFTAYILGRTLYLSSSFICLCIDSLMSSFVKSHG